MSGFDYQSVLSECSDGIRTITLNRPECLNAMNRQLLTDAALAFRDANADDATRVILFTGAGRAFCAGDDREGHRHPENEAEARELVDAIQQVTREILFGAKPVVGAIHGWAVGGGFEWAINCDFSVWAQSARAFFPEMSLNLFVTGAVTALLPAMVGLARAREMLLLGDRYSAAELKDFGVAWRVVDDDRLLDESRAVAMRLAALPPRAVRDMKRVMNLCAQADIERALALETEATVAGFLDPETTRRLKDF
ncbi:MAG TPA: enoyl-CoA hydratase/isomerase family protein [Gammaproteobacteria bacterium]|nr:enoyl-CoA hydratase/isomerase family protein [Gammaproteobacteria bacterium]